LALNLNATSIGAAAGFAPRDTRRAKPLHRFVEGTLPRAACPKSSRWWPATPDALVPATPYPRARLSRWPCLFPAAEKNYSPSRQTSLSFHLRCVSAPRISNTPHAVSLPICCAAALPAAMQPAWRSLPGSLASDWARATFSSGKPRRTAASPVPRSSRYTLVGGALAAASPSSSSLTLSPFFPGVQENTAILGVGLAAPNSPFSWRTLSSGASPSGSGFFFLRPGFPAEAQILS